jgi:hypothetical protein
MTIGKGKRPRDPNQLAKWIVDQSTGDAPEPPQGPPAPPTSLPPDLSAYMAANTARGGIYRRQNAPSPLFHGT